MIQNLAVLVGCSYFLGGLAEMFSPEWILFWGTIPVLLLVGMTGTGALEKRIKAGHQVDAAGAPKIFTLSYGAETVLLEPGKPWIKVDSFKWVMRDLIEDPQSFHVLPDGSVNINGEKISPTDPEGTARLEHEINKRHDTAAESRSPTISVISARASAQSQALQSGKVLFRVKLDPLSHLSVESYRGVERVETGLRGLPMLIQNGFMLKPKSLHIDPLQRSLEIDGAQFECTEAGARLLEQFLNTNYAPALKSSGENEIEIKENPASATGFNIRFVTVHSGARIEVKGHLTQERLDFLQDPAKCDLLQPGIMLRLSPPNLLIRRRRANGGEERLPEFPDLQYRHATALQLQQLFNHPLVHRTAGKVETSSVSPVPEAAAELVAIRVVRSPANKTLLWLEFVTNQGGSPDGKALTHHNLAELLHQGIFLPHLDINLSLDNRTLSVLNKETKQDESLVIDIHSHENELDQASRLLTAALKPPTIRPASPPNPIEAVSTPIPDPEHSGESPALVTVPDQGLGPAAPLPARPQLPAPTAAVTTMESSEDFSRVPVEPAEPISPVTANSDAAVVVEAPSTESVAIVPPDVAAATQPAAATAPSLDPAILSLFGEADPQRINNEVFRRLGPWFGVAVQDIPLSLPRVFENRRFEILSFSHPEITSVLELRSEEFFGFYLSHINEHRLLLVYACKGRHVEWGPDRCLLEAAVTAEANEFKGSALLGMAQDRDRHFVFVVRNEYQEWVKPFEKTYEEALVHFVTVAALASRPDDYTLIWPEPPIDMAQPSGSDLPA